MSFHQSVVWVNHEEAHIMHLDPDSAKTKQMIIQSQHRLDQLAHRKSAVGVQHAREEQQFYEQISLALWGTAEILVVGPDGAKAELIDHIKRCNAPLADRILHVEDRARQSDQELLDFAQEFFRKDDDEVSKQNDFG